MHLFCVADAKDDSDGADYSGAARDDAATYRQAQANAVHQTFQAVRALAGTPEAEALRVWADGRSLAEKALAENSEWRAEVAAKVAALGEAADARMAQEAAAEPPPLPLDESADTPAPDTADDPPAATEPPRRWCEEPAPDTMPGYLPCTLPPDHEGQDHRWEEPF
jgi:hypothetical protein